MNREAFPRLTAGPDILDFRSEFLYSDKVLVRVFVLNRAKGQLMSRVLVLVTNLSILARNLDFIDLVVLELRQVVTENIHRLSARPRIQECFVSIAPLLELPNKFVMIRSTSDEVLVEFSLYEKFDQLIRAHNRLETHSNSWG